ncbi:MAG: hypothetical protein WAV28_08955 [Sedimentisphaerales bacterium]
MAEQEFCEKCKQKHNCQEVYRRLGDVKGPSVVIKVVVAFLLPLVVFIVCLAVSEKILDRAISNEQLQTALSCLLALLSSFVCVLIVRVIHRRAGQGR